MVENWVRMKPSDLRRTIRRAKLCISADLNFCGLRWSVGRSTKAHVRHFEFSGAKMSKFFAASSESESESSDDEQPIVVKQAPAISR